MSSVQAVAVLLVLLWTTTKGEKTQVSCVLNKSCVLPCSLKSGPDPVIHWLKTPGEVPVHSYYHGQDQFSFQNQDFKNRTSLFVDQISRGIASLLLRGVKLQDEGTYKCFTSTADRDTASKNSFINLTVRASVRFVNIEQRGDELICSSKDIYPKPDVSWSLRPPPLDVEPKTSVSVSEKGLYSIFSSVRLSHNPPEEHSCNITTDHSWSSATYRLQLRSISGSEVTVPCSAANVSIKSIIWKFNHTQTILTQTGTNRVYNKSWRQFVEEVTESGRLILKDLTSGHKGVYSCLLSSDRETHISCTVVRKEDPLSTTVYVVPGVLLFLLLIVSLILLRWKRLKDSQRLRELEQERLRELEQQYIVLKEQYRSLSDRHKDLVDILASEGFNQEVSQRLRALTQEPTSLKPDCRSLSALFKVNVEQFNVESPPPSPPSDRTEQSEESEQTRAPEEIPLIELTQGNQQSSELL